MAATQVRVPSRLRKQSVVERWFFTGIALAMIVTCLAGFIPSIAHPAGRRAPISVLALAHGVVFFAWLLLFLVQSRLVATRHIMLHRRFGLASILLLMLMIPLAYMTTIAMIRRGFDLSGDLRIDGDPAYGAVFALSNLLIFSALAILALVYRRRPELHKRLILFANIELMPAPLAHLIGHTPSLASLPGGIIMIPICIFVIAALARDLLTVRRIHPLTWTLGILRIISGPLEAGPIGTSPAWHHFINRLIQ